MLLFVWSGSVDASEDRISPSRQLRVCTLPRGRSRLRNGLYHVGIGVDRVWSRLTIVSEPSLGEFGIRKSLRFDPSKTCAQHARRMGINGS